MRNSLIRLVNWAHTQRATIIRRGVLSLAVAGLALWQVFWWLILLPLFVILYAPIMAVIAFSKAVAEIPLLTFNQIKSDAGEWSRDIPGIVRIWRTRKVEPKIIRDAP